MGSRAVYLIFESRNNSHLVHVEKQKTLPYLDNYVGHKLRKTKWNVNACYPALVFIIIITLSIRPFTQISRADPAESLDLGNEWSVVPSGRLVEV